jgi:hypothetical protein
MRLGLSLRFLWSLGLRWRKITAKAKSDSAGNAEVALVERAEAVQMAGEDVIGRPKLNSDMAKEPIVNATARGERHRLIGHGIPGERKYIRPVLANQAVYKAGEFVGAIPKREAWPQPPGEIVALQSRNTTAIAPLVAAEVPLQTKVMKQAYRSGKLPAIELQLLGARLRARRHVKVQVRVAAEYIHRRNILRGRSAQKKED